VSGRLAKGARPGARISLITGLANLAGVAVVVLFFALTDGAESVGHNGLYNLVATFILVAGGIVWGNYWSKDSARFEKLPLEERRNHPDLERIQALAINTPLVTAGISLAMWAIGGVLIGVLIPLLLDHFDLSQALISVLGISIIGGTITTVCVFFGIEALWRPNIPFFLEDRPIHTVPGALRLPVKVRMIGAIILVSLIPLVITGLAAYSLAQELAQAGPGEKQEVLRTLSLTVTYLLLASSLVSVLVAAFLANSVAKPLRSLTLAMNRVGRGDFTTRLEPTTNDEIGALTDGFNTMIQGLARGEEIREAMHRYLDPEVAAQILNGRLNVEGEMVDVTLLFSDLREFTTFAEANHPKLVLAKLNQYYTAMTEVIRGHGGVVLQYVGDEIEAVFGAPLPDPLHPDKALAAALAMRQALAGLNQAWTRDGEAALAHGIGIHTGLALAGSVGSPDRQSYALVGDTVNTASRVAGLCKEFQTDLLVSQATVQRLSPGHDLTALKSVPVKGRRGQITVYKV